MLADLLWADLGFGTAAIAGVGTAQMWVQIIMGSRRRLDIAARFQPLFQTFILFVAFGTAFSQFVTKTKPSLGYSWARVG